jgi:hypothetical protein
MKQLKVNLTLLFIFIFHVILMAQAPTSDEAISLVITQKKASDHKDAMPFTIAPGSRPKLFPGHYTSYYNTECIVVCSLLQGREVVQVVLLLYKSKEGYWKNGCWYYDNIYRLKVKDFNKDSVLELILETKLNAGNRAFGNYKIISLINQNTDIWYENSSILGYDPTSLKNALKGKEITKDIKITFNDTLNNAPSIIKERIILGKFNSYSDSTGVKLDFETKFQEYKFVENKYYPKLR